MDYDPAGLVSWLKLFLSRFFLFFCLQTHNLKPQASLQTGLQSEIAEYKTDISKENGASSHYSWLFINSIGKEWVRLSLTFLHITFIYSYPRGVWLAISVHWSQDLELKGMFLFHVTRCCGFDHYTRAGRAMPWVFGFHTWAGLCHDLIINTRETKSWVSSFSMGRQPFCNNEYKATKAMFIKKWKELATYT